MPFADPKKKAAYKKQWKEKNKEKCCLQNREHQETHRLKYPKKYGRKTTRLTNRNRDIWMKLHGLESMIGKSEEEITSAINQIQKRLFRKTQKRYQRKISRQVSKYLWDYKSVNPCESCGEDDPCCLDFHHIDEKTKRDNMSRLVRSGIKAVLAEIKKCQILCSNCHRKHHFYARQKLLHLRRAE